MAINKSVFSFLPSTSTIIGDATSIATNAVGSSVGQFTSGLSGLPSSALGALTSGINGSVSSLLGQFGGGPSGGDNSPSWLKEFLTDIQSNGVAWNNRFYVTFQPPKMMINLLQNGTLVTRPSLSGGNPSDSFHLMMRTDMAELPGVSFTTSEVKNYAPVMRMPNQIVYNDLNLSFILSADMVEKYFFDYWIYSMRDPNNMYEYYDNIVSDIYVAMYSLNNQPVYGVRFFEAWPISIMPISISWQDMEYMRLSVTFAYRRWEPVVFPPIQLQPPTENAPGGISATNSILSNFFFNMLPSIPGGAKFLGLSQLTSSQAIRAGVSAIGNAARTNNPVTNAVVKAGVNSFNQFFGGQ